MDNSAKRICFRFKASTLISSENAIPSDSSRISFRMDLRKTHIPDCESRTQRKNSSDMARDSAQLPNLCLKLIALASRTGNLQAFRKSTSRCRNASSKYDMASGG